VSFLGSLSSVTSGLGRGLEDLFTLGTAELARRYGGNTANNVFGVLDKGMGANWEAGAAGGLGMLGAQGLGLTGGASAMSPYMPTSAPAMSQAGSTLGAGMGSSMNLAPAYGSATGAAAGSPFASTAAASSPISQALNYMRMGGSGGQQSAPQQNALQRLQAIYQMFPNLSPFQGMGGPNG
jgi:hypothetical protein